MTTEQIVIEEITSFVDSSTLEDIGTITGEHNIRLDLGIDSLEEIEIVLNLEKRFNIYVPDAQAEEIKTVGDVVRLVEEQIKISTLKP